ncbi:ABC transporter ATP-binding protein [Flavilitoribacter nigricans]|uniref:ABC transporter n=1 Tax=Flavilitoribacter nigricans (strain ATCC 23147 / DSM 23189 / NBRC 102662 / NCIMB 1420 / SS-2) TaxID=1122177 RepID=A0A2D0NBF6_FLAN2|nr:ABC transporter ATP-binding protein [Flavilitoribacter nigricans]PHN05509.1 ABC transporter [Flavilitoribacter nigricans DSM 23189 = NBRC 102662]
MLLTARHISKSFGRKHVLRDISFELQAGSLYGIVGENGSGKSTLLKIIVGAWEADSGTISLNGKLGYCPQEALLFPLLTVAEHFRYFAAAYGIPKDIMKKRADHLLDHFNFKKYEKEKVANLSGGTQQKLNLTLALLPEPDLLVLDEPYNGFDWDTYLRFWEYTGQLRQQGCAVLVVTHLLSERERFDRIYDLKNGQLM